MDPTNVWMCFLVTHMWKLNPKVRILGGAAFGKCFMRGSGLVPYRWGLGSSLASFPPCEGSVRRQPSATGKRTFTRTQAVWHSWYQTSSPQNYEKYVYVVYQLLPPQSSFKMYQARPFLQQLPLPYFFNRPTFILHLHLFLRTCNMPSTVLGAGNTKPNKSEAVNVPGS